MKQENSMIPKKINPFPLLLIILGFILLKNKMDQAKIKELSYSEFLRLVDKKEVKNIVIKGETLLGEFDSKDQKHSNFKTRIVKKEISDDLYSKGINFKSIEEKSPLSDVLLLFLPTLLFIGFWYFLMRRGLKNMGPGGNLMGLGKSKAKIFNPTNSSITFSDVAGADEALEELKEVIDFLKNSKKVQSLGGKMPKGILLVGAPGTGKTLIAKAMAGEAKVPFFSCSGSEFVEMFVGVGAARVRDLFQEAKKSAPCIIFIDELDALGKMRQINSFGGNDEKEQTLNQLLVEMDGFDTQGGIIILAATNRPEMIDPALLRAGRFDRQVVVDRPDKIGREQILKIHLQKTKCNPQLSLSTIAGLTPGFTGADLANLVNEAALIATRKNASQIEELHFTLALERIVAGVEKKNKILLPKERETVAVHELGHALVGYFFFPEDRIHKVSIIPHGIGSMGHTIQRPTEDKFMMTKNYLKNKLAVLLAGRAAEILCFHEISTGAADDLSKATNLASDMITKFGMDEEIGFISYDQNQNLFLGNRNTFLNPNLSQNTLTRIDDAIKNLLDEAYHNAYDFLKLNEEILMDATKVLLQRESLNEEDLKVLFNNLKGKREMLNFLS